MTTGNNTELTVQTREIVVTHDDIKDIFLASNMTVADPDQEFTIVIRRSLAIGDRDVVVGRVRTGDKIVAQFKEVIGPAQSSNP